MVKQKKFNTKSPIIFNEYEYGKYLNDNSDNDSLRPKVYNIKELAVLAKYYRTLKDNRTEVRNKLIQFCNLNYIGFDVDIKYGELNQAIEIAFEQKMRTCNGVPITKNEWEKIQLIEDEKGQKILFVMLAISKFNRLNPIIKEEEEKEIAFKDTRLRCYLQDKDLFRLAKVQYRNIQDYYDLYYYYIHEHHLIDLIPANTSKVVLNFGDLEPTEEEIAEVKGNKIIITDMDNLMDIYKALKNPDNMKVCKKCGRWFEDKSKSKRLLLCSDCRKVANEYDKLEEQKEIGRKQIRRDQAKENEIKTFKCIDCNQIVGKNKYNSKSFRCRACQSNYEQSLLIGKHIIRCTNCGEDFVAKSGKVQRTLCDGCYKEYRKEQARIKMKEKYQKKEKS